MLVLKMDLCYFLYINKAFKKTHWDLRINITNNHEHQYYWFRGGGIFWNRYNQQQCWIDTIISLDWKWWKTAEIWRCFLKISNQNKIERYFKRFPIKINGESSSEFRPETWCFNSIQIGFKIYPKPRPRPRPRLRPRPT